MGATIPTISTKIYNVIDPAYGALGNGKKLADITTTSSSAVISSASYSFTASDVGKLITIAGAAAAGAVLNATISSVSSGNATLSKTAGTSIAGTASATFGSDDTSAIQSAINAASTAGGGLVFLPSSIFVVSGSLTWASLVSMKGNGAGKSILKFIKTTDMTAAVIIGTSATFSAPYIDCQFTDFEIDCLAATMATPTYAGKAIFIQYMLRPVFSRLFLHDSPATALGTDFLKEAVISDNIIENGGRLAPPTGGAGIGIGVGGNASFVESYSVVGNKVINGYSFGIFFETQTGSVITTAYAECVGNTVIQSATSKYGIGDCGLTGFVCVGNTVVGAAGCLDGIAVRTGTLGGKAGVQGLIACNVISAAGANAISLDYSATGADPGVFSGYQVINNKIYNSVSGGMAVLPGASAFNSLTIAGNEIVGSGNAGIIFATGGGGGIQDLIMENNKLINNAITTATSTRKCGVSINCALTRPRIKDNICFDNATGKQLYALIVNGVSLTGSLISDNDFSNNATGAISLVSGSIAGVVKNNNAYNPIGPSSVTPGASPWTYTNGTSPSMLYISGGTVSSITKGGVTLATASGVQIQMNPNDAIVVTYSAAPTVVSDVQ